MEKANNHIDTIISHYLNGKISDKELVVLNQWLKESDENKKSLQQLESIWKQRSTIKSFHDEDAIAKSIWSKVHKSGGSAWKIQFNYLVRAAAILLLIVSVAIIVNFNQEENEGSQLTTIAEITKTNPFGQKSQIILPDGSKVWLNSGSSITYPESFIGSQRSVKLDGEAFFNVVEDTVKKFTVIAGKVKTTALGTSFNVSAYADAPVQVSLLSGKVKVENPFSNESLVMLTPGLAVSYGDAELANVFQFNENILAWRSGILIFENDNFDEFLQKIERWYGVQIKVIGKKPTDWNFNATYENTYLKEILNHVSYSKDIKYELNEKNLTLWIEK